MRLPMSMSDARAHVNDKGVDSTLDSSSQRLFEANKVGLNLADDV